MKKCILLLVTILTVGTSCTRHRRTATATAAKTEQTNIKVIETLRRGGTQIILFEVDGKRYLSNENGALIEVK